MAMQNDKLKLINAILENEEEKTLEEEEIIHLLLEHKVARDVSNKAENESTLGAKMADGIARWAQWYREYSTSLEK